jgi:hypothetical protein
MPAEFDERIVDDSYNAVFPLRKEQVTSHLCSTSKKKLSNMRVRLEDDTIITESTDGKAMIQVKERATVLNIAHFPFDVNPSEAPKNVLAEPKLIPGSLLDDIAKGFPKRKNFQKHQWQKAAVFSFQKDSDDIEVGRADKQGRPTLDKVPAAGEIVFPPVDDVLKAIDDSAAAATVRLEIGLLKKLIEAMENAGTEYVKLMLWGGAKDPAKFVAVNKWGANSSREVVALIMPVAEKA